MSWNRFVALLVTVSLLSGCTSRARIQPAIAVGQPLYDTLQPGDTVIVHTRAGVRRPIVIAQIDGETIVGRGGVRFTRQDVVHLQRRALSGPTKTILIVGTAAVVVFLIFSYWFGKNTR